MVEERKKVVTAPKGAIKVIKGRIKQERKRWHRNKNNIKSKEV